MQSNFDYTTKAEYGTFDKNSKIGLTKEKLEDTRLVQSKSNVNLWHDNSMDTKKSSAEIKRATEAYKPI